MWTTPRPLWLRGARARPAAAAERSVTASWSLSPTTSACVSLSLSICLHQLQPCRRQARHFFFFFFLGRDVRHNRHGCAPSVDWDLKGLYLIGLQECDSVLGINKDVQCGSAVWHFWSEIKVWLVLLIGEVINSLCSTELEKWKRVEMLAEGASGKKVFFFFNVSF